MSEIELTKSTEQNAASLSSDLRATYNLGAAPSLLSAPRTPSVFPAKKAMK